jgi:hypothetical protein
MTLGAAHPIGRWLIAVAGLSLTFLSTGARHGAARLPSRPAPRTAFAALPLRFEENDGQFAPRVRYMARASGATLSLADDGATLSLRFGPTLTLGVAGGASAAPRASDELVTRTHYLRGNDPSKWLTNVRSFGRVTYPSAVDGVNLVFHGEGEKLEYDFVVAPGVDPTKVALEVGGAQGLSLTSTGELAIRTTSGQVVQPRPRVYQVVDGREEEVPGSYRLVDDTRVAFDVASYDSARELVIDPTIAYATYLGGSGEDEGTTIAVDGSGSVYVAGSTTSVDFPTAGALQANANANTDAFIAKLDPSGSSLVYATYLGGRADDEASGIAVDTMGQAYLTGTTLSDDFPTSNALYDAFRGPGDGGCPETNAFVAELSPSGGSLVYSTYLGGGGGDHPRGIAVDSKGDAYVAGWTASPDFPTKNPLFGWPESDAGVPDESFVTELAPSGGSLVYSTLLPGNVDAIAVDGSGDAFVTGATPSSAFPTKTPIFPSINGSSDAFVTEISPAGGSLVYSTFLGGSGDDAGTGIAVDAVGNAYVVGQTTSTDFPTAGPLFTAGGMFVTKLAASGASLGYSTYFPAGSSIAVDSAANAYVAGSASTGFPPVAPLPSSSSNVTGKYNGVVAELSPTGSALLFSTYVGDGAGAEGQEQQIHGIAVSPDGNVYVTGTTDWTNFPVNRALCALPPPGANAFVVWIAPAAVTPGGTTPGGDACPAPGTPVVQRGGPTGAPAQCAPMVVDSEARACAVAYGAPPPGRGWLVAWLATLVGARARRSRRNRVCSK